jgi:hypothetical protein
MADGSEPFDFLQLDMIYGMRVSLTSERISSR